MVRRLDTGIASPLYVFLTTTNKNMSEKFLLFRSLSTPPEADLIAVVVGW